MVTLNELLKDVHIIRTTARGECPVDSLTYDSRRVEKDGIFIAIRGFKTDGHRYIAEAVANGAAVVVVEDSSLVPEGIPFIEVENTRETLGLLAANYYQRPAAKMRLIGVTGTNGKTTTTYLLETLLRSKGSKVGLLGTVSNRVGSVQLEAERTTPESLDLQRLLHLISRNGGKTTVMEVSSHALELSRVTGCEFDVGVFTNLSQDHLDFHANMESYLHAKGKLFSSLGEGQKQGPKYAVINADAPEADYFYRLTRAPIITYGFNSEAEVRAEEVKLYRDGSSFVLNYPGGRKQIHLNMTGRFSIYNVLAACAVALQEDIDAEIVGRVLAEFQGVPGRFELVNCGQEFTVVVDYAHTPDGLENVLQAAGEFISGDIITVFGCGGDRDKDKRPQMGRIASKYSNYCIVTSDNPRSEEPEAIINDILPGMKEYQTGFEVEPDRISAITRALSLAKKGDLVMIAGKGHETYQEVKGEKIPFDDRKVVREVMGEKGECGAS